MLSQHSNVFEEKQQDKWKLEEYIGVVPKMTGGLNLFANLDDLQDPSRRFIYFTCYSTGKKSIVYWGTYDRINQMFNFINRCRFRSFRQINDSLQQWKENGFNIVGNITENKIRDRINFYRGQKMLSYEEYHANKLMIAHLRGLISNEQLQTLLSESQIDDFYLAFERRAGMNIVIDYDRALADYLSSIEQRLNEYEQGINRIDFIKDNLSSGSLLELQYMTNLFYSQIQNGSYFQHLMPQDMNDCPNMSECSIESDNELCGVYFHRLGNFYLDLS